LKERWFATPPDWSDTDHSLDFRVGGVETNQGRPPGGQLHRFEARYQDIVDNERIVYAYENGTKLMLDALGAALEANHQ
jgi:uncharacterized protein YndB with AHSA1/START domain